MQISRFTASKPSKFAFASDEKSIRQPTTSFVWCYLRSADSENLTTSNKSQVGVGETEGVKGAIADFVRFHCPLSPPQRRNPCLRKSHAMSARPTAWSRPFGATMCEWLVEQVGGAPAGAQSYWQGRFAACAFVDFSFGVVNRGTVGALPQTPPEAPPLDSARGIAP